MIFQHVPVGRHVFFIVFNSNSSCCPQNSIECCRECNGSILSAATTTVNGVHIKTAEYFYVSVEKIQFLFLFRAKSKEIHLLQ